MTKTHNNSTTIDWITDLSARPKGCPPQYWQWLVNPGSLSKRLRDISGDAVHMQLLQADWGDINPEEHELLPPGAKQQRYWIREIVHTHQQQAWVWGRTVIPQQTLEKTTLTADSTQPIGNILFTDSHLQRQISICQLSASHPYYQNVLRYLQKPAENLWGRRSIFWFQHQPLLVIEVFLPHFFASLDHDTDK